MNDVARRIREMSSVNNCWIIDLSQVANDKKKYIKGDVIPAKWSWELINSADYVFILEENKVWRLNFTLAKNRHWIKGTSVELMPNFSICDFVEEWEAVSQSF